MEITRFEVAADLMVTLYMREMPKEVKSHNTSVYIAGNPQGNPAIYFTAQRIVFKANSDAVKGKIAVMSGDLTAESAEDYKPPAEELPVNQRPLVQSISQQTAAPGERRTLRGQNLGDVDGVALFTGAKYHTCTGIVANNDSVQFGVPLSAPASERLLPVFIRTHTYPALTRTPVSLRIVER